MDPDISYLTTSGPGKKAVPDSPLFKRRENGHSPEKSDLFGKSRPRVL